MQGCFINGIAGDVCPDMVVETDTSLLGWRTVCNGVCVQKVYDLEHLQYRPYRSTVQCPHASMDILSQSDQGIHSQSDGPSLPTAAAVPAERHHLVSRASTRLEQPGSLMWSRHQQNGNSTRFSQL